MGVATDSAATVADPRRAPAAVLADETITYARSPSDLLRLIVFALLSIGVLAITRWAEESLLDLERDLISLLGFLSVEAERIVAGVAHVLLAFVLVVVVLPPILLKRYRVLAYLAVGNALAFGLTEAALWWLDRDKPPELTNRIAERAGLR